MTFLLPILHDLHAMLFTHFWRTWITLTAGTAICVAWAVGRAGRGQSWNQSQRELIPTWRQFLTPEGIAALALLAAFLVSFIAITLAWEDFAYDDNSWFTVGSLRGHNIPPEIWPSIGRFCPLNWQEFSLIRHFTDTISGYHVLPIAELFIFVCMLLILDDELSIAARAALAILALLTPSILISFSGLIFPERNELFFLVCLVLSVKRFEQTESTAWAVAAALCAQIMLYYKETAFLLLLGFAAGRLVLHCRNGDHATWDYDRLWDKEGRLDLSFAGLAALFLLFYFAAMGLHGNMHYATERQQPLVGTLLTYWERDLLAWLLVAVVLGRMYLILRRRAEPLPLWDGLALGGVACFLAYLYLRILFEPWYLAPVDLIALLYVGRFAVLSLKKIGALRGVAVFSLAVTVVLQNIFFSTGYVFGIKNDIHAKAEIASVVEERYQDHGGTLLRLFFPFARPYVIMEFASYLSYRGIPVEGEEGEGAGLADVVLAGKAIAEDGPCVGYRDFWCHAASRPAPGDLVIVLPDDEVSSAEASAYRPRRELLFSYEPRPPVPQWLHSLVSDLEKVPDRWMDASVTIWK
jgi:hypothetical protein